MHPICYLDRNISSMKTETINSLLHLRHFAYTRYLIYSFGRNPTHCAYKHIYLFKKIYLNFSWYINILAESLGLLFAHFFGFVLFSIYPIVFGPPPLMWLSYSLVHIKKILSTPSVSRWVVQQT